jgi:NhaA family Na+:H+ antiporter
MPHGTRSFGLFAEAEGLLTDPLNRLEHRLMPFVTLVMLAFGLTRGGIDLAAAGPTTLVTLAAFCLGKPAGILIMAGLLSLFGFARPRGLGRSDIAIVAALMGIGFATPLLTLETTLPGGAMQEAGRLGLALTIAVGPLLWLITRRSQD